MYNRPDTVSYHKSPVDGFAGGLIPVSMLELTAKLAVLKKEKLLLTLLKAVLMLSPLPLLAVVPVLISCMVIG
jgi:hypothetical protein